MTIDDGRQIYLSETDLDLLKTLLQPGADLDDDGYPVNDQGILYVKLVDQHRSNQGALWVSMYEETQAYGGPEEGDWWYTHHELVDSQAFTDPDKLLTYYNETYTDLRSEYHCMYGLDHPLTLEDLERSVAASIELNYDCDPICITRFEIARREELVLCIEVQLGSQQTIGRPTYC